MFLRLFCALALCVQLSATREYHSSKETMKLLRTSIGHLLQTDDVILKSNGYTLSSPVFTDDVVVSVDDDSDSNNNKVRFNLKH